MKKALFDWRMWLIFAQICVAIILIIAEPNENGHFWHFIWTLLASKVAGALLVLAVWFEAKLWRNRCGFLDKMVS